MTSTETRMRIRNLATFTTDPNQAGELMLEAAKQRVNMTKKILALNYLKGVKRRRGIEGHTSTEAKLCE